MHHQRMQDCREAVREKVPNFVDETHDFYLAV
jgi:hypothetical protein